jgi:hypothetical protein
MRSQRVWNSKAYKTTNEQSTLYISERSLVLFISNRYRSYIFLYLQQKDHFFDRAVVVVIYGSWIYSYLCNQCLHVSQVVSSNPIHGEVYQIQHYGIKFISDVRLVGGFLWFPPPIKLTATI